MSLFLAHLLGLPMLSGRHIDKLGAQQRRIVMQQVKKNGNDSLTEAILGNQERCINLLLISGDSGFSSARGTYSMIPCVCEI